MKEKKKEKKKKHSHNSPLYPGDNRYLNMKRSYLRPKINMVPIELEAPIATSVHVKTNSVGTNYENYENQDINGNEIQLF